MTAAAHFLIAAMQLLCTPTPAMPIVPVVGPGRGVDPVWLVADGGTPGDVPNKMLWVFRTREHVRIEGRALANGRPTRFQIDGGETPMLDAIVLDDPHRVTVIPGGASAEIMKEYSFLPSYVYFPQPGCFEFTIQLEHSSRRIVVEVQ